MLNLQPVSSYLSLFQIPKHSIETYCPSLMLCLWFIILFCLSLPSFHYFSRVTQRALRSPSPASYSQDDSHTCNTSKGMPLHHDELNWLLLHINIWLIFHHLWEADQLTDISPFVILYHSVLLSIIVPQLLFYICFCLCLGYFLNLKILVNLFIHSKKQRA